MPQPPAAFLLGERLLVVQAAQSLQSRGIRVVGIASRNPDVLQWASRHQIFGFDTRRGNKSLLEAVRSVGAFDYLLSVTYLSMIPAEVIAAADRMAVNFHDSMLPVPIEIADDETTLTLNTKCFEAATESLNTLIDRLLDDKSIATPQDLSHRTYFTKSARPHAAGWIDHRRTAHQCSALVRSLDFGDRFENPIALPKIWLNENWYCVRSCRVTENTSNQPVGTVIGIDGSQVLIATATQDVLLGRISDVSGRPIDEPAIRETFFGRRTCRFRGETAKQRKLRSS